MDIKLLKLPFRERWEHPYWVLAVRHASVHQCRTEVSLCRKVEHTSRIRGKRWPWALCSRNSTRHASTQLSYRKFSSSPRVELTVPEASSARRPPNPKSDEAEVPSTPQEKDALKVHSNTVVVTYGAGDRDARALVMSLDRQRLDQHGY